MAESFTEELKRQTKADVEFRGEFIGHIKMILRNEFAAKNMEWQKEGFDCLTYIPTIMGHRREGETGALPGPFPDILTGFQINEMLDLIYRKDFSEFGPVPNPPMPEQYSYLQLDQAFPQFGVFALNLFQIVIDHRNLDGLPVPKSWEALLDPMYRGKICLNGTKYGPDLHILAWFYKKFGTRGVEGLKKNVGAAMHASRMSRNMGSKQGYGICVINRFFALACKGREGIELIWPREGAIVQPIWVMVKAGKAGKYATLLAFLFGSRLGQIMADNGYISLAEGVTYKAEPEGLLDWYGWDLIQRKDSPEIVTYLRKLFQDVPG